MTYQPLLGYLMPKPSEEKLKLYLISKYEDEKVYTFHKCIGSKVNVIV